MSLPYFKHIKPSFAVVVLFFCSSLCLSAADDWKTGLPLEEGGNYAGASEVYRNWLEHNAGDEDYFTVLRRFLNLQGDPEAFFYQARQDWPITAPQKAEVYRWAGRTAELARDPQGAREWYLLAYNAHPYRENLDLLLEAAEMDLMMGEFDSARSALDFTAREDRAGTFREPRLLLLSRLEYFRGNAGASQAAWQELEGDKLTAGSLIWGVRLNRELGNIREAEQLERRLLAEYPREGRAVLEGTWGEPINPGGLLGGSFLAGSARPSGPAGTVSGPGAENTPAPYSPAPAGQTAQTAQTAPVSPGPAPAVPAAATFMIQTGSFRDRDNAEVQRDALIRLGFRAEVRTGDLGGGPLYRVMVLGVTQETQGSVLEKLRAGGFDGFPVR